MSKNILIIEDDRGIRLSLKDELESEGFGVFEAGDGEKGLTLAKQKRPDLILLDLMLPVLNGYDVCKRLRAAGDTTPIIMLTVKDREVDKILGLEFGADDYVTKPFSLREVVARVRAILRRSAEREKGLDAYRFGGVELDFKRFVALKDKQKLDLTPLEFQILKLLIQKKEEVISRNDFLDKIWGEDNVSVSFRTIDSHIANIRRKIEDDPANPKHILSVRSVGYKFMD
jgi:DNA-binding response OmpR family regulator